MHDILRNPDSRLRWHQKEQEIEEADVRPEFSQRDIWLCYLGINIGDEQNGSWEDFLRPIVIFRKFNSHVCLVIPLTRSNKEGYHYFSFNFVGFETSTAILSQLRLIDARRLYTKIGFISHEDYFALKEKLRTLLS